MKIVVLVTAVDGKVVAISAYSQGIGYHFVEQTKINGVEKFTFDIPLLPDTTQTVNVQVSDGIRTGESFG